MKPFGVLKISVILVGVGAAMALSPACKAQEVSPDHFTDNGVQDVYNSASVNAPAPKVKQKQPAPQVQAHQTTSPAKLQPVAKHTPLTSPEPGAQPVADKRKLVPRTPKKPQ
jgi:hypothetical protein